MALTLLVFPINYTYASDGIPPSQETVCDGLEDPLFGLCNSFCEALDCDNPSHLASDKACAKIAANFLGKSGGLPLPCLESANISLLKKVNGVDSLEEVVTGTPLTFTYLIMNTGNISLSVTSLIDSPSLNNVPQSDIGVPPIVCDAPYPDLGAGESVTCSFADIAQTGIYFNLATVMAESEFGTQVQASDDSSYAGTEEVTIFPPTNLTVTGVSCSTIGLMWDPSTSPSVSGYKVFRGTSSGNYSNITDVGNVTNYTDTGLAPSTQYYYSVKAFDVGNNESPFSNEVVPITGACQPAPDPDPGPPPDPDPDPDPGPGT
jgi:hypothetical protein